MSARVNEFIEKELMTQKQMQKIEQLVRELQLDKQLLEKKIVNYEKSIEQLNTQK